MPDVTAGRRLRAFVEHRVPDTQPGWLDDLAARVGVTTQSLHRYFAGKGEPSMATVGALAAAIGVRRWEIVKALDGD